VPNQGSRVGGGWQTFWFRKKLLGEDGSVRRGVVMVKQPGLFSPKFCATCSHVFTQSSWNLAVEPIIHSFAWRDLSFALPQLLHRWLHQSGIFLGTTSFVQKFKAAFAFVVKAGHIKPEFHSNIPYVIWLSFSGLERFKYEKYFDLDRRWSSFLAVSYKTCIYKIYCPGLLFTLPRESLLQGVLEFTVK
jgi:hypothetical protein